MAPKLPDPRKLLSGTSYNAKGAIPVDPGALAEIGSANAAPIREVVPALGSLGQRITTFDKMTTGDATVDVSLRAGKVPVFGADWFMEPYSQRPEHLEMAEFAFDNIFNGLNVPFLIVMEEILRMYEYGFSILEKVYEEREWAPKRTGANRRKYTMLRKLAPRPASTLVKFNYDANGGPVGMTQNVIDEKGNVTQKDIPIEKLLIFTLNKKGGNLEGKSLLRTSYRNWYYKDHLYKIDAIQAERHGIGIPDIELFPGANDDDKKFAHEMGKNLRTNEEAYVVRPQGMTVGFIKFEGEMLDIMRKIEHHDAQIMLNVMVQFLLLGIEGQGGGRATSASHMDMFIKSLRYVGNLICEYFNMFVIPQLIAYNFDTYEFPEMRVRSIGEAKDLQMAAAAFGNLAAQGLITPDEDTENWIRRNVLDMPDKTGTYVDPNKVVEPSTNGKGDTPVEGVSRKGRQTGDRQGNVGKGPSEG